MPTLSWGVQWSACLVWSPLRDVGSLAPAPLLYEELLPGASLHMPTLSWGVQWSTCLSGLRRVSSVFQFLPLLHRRLLLGTSCAHAHFISGRPVEYLSVWSSVMRLSSCGSCLFAIQRASSWSLFCACPLYLGASSGVPICLASIMRLLCWSFLSDIFPQASLSSCPGSWLSPEGNVSLPLLSAFSRIRFILCQFLLGAYFAEHF